MKIFRTNFSVHFLKLSFLYLSNFSCCRCHCWLNIAITTHLNTLNYKYACMHLPIDMGIIFFLNKTSTMFLNKQNLSWTMVSFKKKIYWTIQWKKNEIDGKWSMILRTKEINFIWIFEKKSYERNGLFTVVHKRWTNEMKKLNGPLSLSAPNRFGAVSQII